MFLAKYWYYVTYSTEFYLSKILTTMTKVYKSLTSKKKIVFGTCFDDGRVRVYIKNADFINEPLYVLSDLSSNGVFTLSSYGIEIHNYPKKDIMIVNKWPNEPFKKVN